MRRLLLALLLGLVAAPSYGGDLYYNLQTSGDYNVYAVAETGGSPRIVLSFTEYTGNRPAVVTNLNHATSNGQAFVRATGDVADIELLYRAADGTIKTNRVTDLGANTFKPFFKPDVTRDDSAFSFRAKDGQGNFALYRLNVSVDQALAPDYVPPTSPQPSVIRG